MQNALGAYTYTMVEKLRPQLVKTALEIRNRQAG